MVAYYCAAFIDSAVVDVKVQSGDCYMTIKNLISGSGTFSDSTSGKDNCETSTCDRAELGRGVEYGLDCVAKFRTVYTIYDNASIGKLALIRLVGRFSFYHSGYHCKVACIICYRCIINDFIN